MKTKTNFYLSILFSLFCIVNLSAQVKGKILDENQNPMEYATVALYNQENKALIAGVVTNVEGNFALPNIEKGVYYLEISFIGYEMITLKDIQVFDKRKPVDVGVLNLSLGNNLNEVVVTGERATFVNKIDRQVFEANKFKKAQGGSGIDVLRNLPSVSIDGQGEINLRGSSGFVVLLNGKPIQGDASTFLAQLPANGIERIEIITAPSAKYDPEGKAGLINVITKKGAADGAFAQVNIKVGFPSIETYDNANSHKRHGIDATYNLMKGAWNVSLGATYQRNGIGGRREGDVFTIINDTLTRFPSSGERSSDEENYSGRFTVDFTPNAQHSFSVGFFGGKRSTKRLADIVYFDNHAVSPINSDDRAYTFQYFNHNLRERKSDFALGSFDYTYTTKNDATFSTSLLYEYSLLGGPTVNQNLGFPDPSILYQDEFNTNNNPLNGIRFQADYKFKPTKIGTIETGYQYRNLDHKGDFVYERRTNFEDAFELVPEFSSEVNLQRDIHSVYGQLNGSKEKWDYAAGARLEAMDRSLLLRDKANTIDTTYHYDFFKLFPTASLRYRFDDKNDLKAAYSKRIERTTTFKMNPFPEREHSETLEQGDPTLRPEFIDLVELSYTRKMKQGNSMYATAYFRNVENLVNRVNTVYNDTILNRIYSNVGNAKSIGLELGTELKLTKSWSQFMGANIYNYAIKGRFDNRPVNSQTTVYSFNYNTTYNFWKNASLQFTFNYLSERVTAQGADSRFYAPNLTFQKSFLNNQLVATFQWLNMDLGLLNANEQRITSQRPGEFFTTTNYIYEVDMLFLNLTYTFKNGKNKSKFIDSEFGKREF